MKRITGLFLFFIFLLATQRLMGGNIVSEVRKSLDTLSSGDTLRVEDGGLPILIGGSPTFKDLQSMGMVRVGLAKDKQVCRAGYIRYEVKVRIDYTERTAPPNTFSNTSVFRTFIVDIDPLNGQPYQEQAIFYIPMAYKIQVVIDTVKSYDINNIQTVVTNWATLDPDLYIEAKIDVERYGNFNPYTSPSGLARSYDAAANEIVISWNNPSNGEEAFELEWIYCNDYVGNSSQYTNRKAHNQVEVSFDYNATRVRLDQPDSTVYRIPCVYDRGYLVYRIRGIGRYSADLEKEIKSQWTYEKAFGTSEMLNMISASYYFPIDSIHQEKMNWQLSVSYAENGKTKSVVGYADGSLRVRQQVTMISSDREAIVAETFYDHQGRAAVQSLPSPTDSSKIKYYPNFNRADVLGTPKYNRAHFDEDLLATNTCINEPVGFATNSGAGKYYSPSNSNQQGIQGLIADAEKYPFTVTHFTRDNTGRIRSQSGVGLQHILGSGHETQYYYGKPKQEQLDMLFGTDVGYAHHYKKNMVVDANGQVSVSYLDMAGRVVATSLAGESPANMKPMLDTNGDTIAKLAAKIMTVDLLNILPDNPHGLNNYLANNGKEWKVFEPLLVTGTTTYDFYYAFSGLDTVNNCLRDLCMDCVYDLNISLIDECGLPVNGAQITYRIGGDSLDTLCNAPQGMDTAFSVILNTGSYTLIKSLTLNEQALDYYTEEYLKRDTCLKKLQDFYTPPDTIGCAFTCELCEAEILAQGPLDTFIVNYIRDLALDTSQVVDTVFYTRHLTKIWREKVERCALLCMPPAMDLCETGRKMMIGDMSPKGQYARFNMDPLTGIVSFDSTIFSSILRDTFSVLPRKYNNQFAPGSNFPSVAIASWRNPVLKTGPAAFVFEYRDETGAPARVGLDIDILGNYSPLIINPFLVTLDPATGEYYTVPENLLRVEDFISEFKDTWANSLIIYHPEYFHYQWCDSTTYIKDILGGDSLNSHQFDRALLDMDYLEAQLRLGPNFDIRSIDPFFIHHGTKLIDHVTSVDQFYENIQDKYIKTNPLPFYFNLWESVYITNYLGGLYAINNYTDLVNALNVACPGCVQGDYIQTENDWQTLRSFYHDIKQRVMSFGMNIHAFDRGVVNSCIGNQNYVPSQSSAQFNFRNPCCAPLSFFYQQFESRFPSTQLAYQLSGTDNQPPTLEELQQISDQNYYNESGGQCPMARDLEAMLNRLALKNKLITGMNSVNLNGGGYITKLLYDTLVVTQDTIYTTVLSPDEKILIWNLQRGCNLKLRIPQQLDSYVKFSNVIGFRKIKNVVSNGNTYYFTIEISVINPNNNQKETYRIDGETCIPLDGCEGTFKALCKVTPQAKRLLELMGTLQARDSLHRNMYPIPFSYDGFLGPELTAPLGTPTGGYAWNYATTLTDTSFRLINQTTWDMIEVVIANSHGYDFTKPGILLNFRPVNPTSNLPGTTGHFLLDAVQYPGPYYVPHYPFGDSLQPTHHIEGWIRYVGMSDTLFPLSECDFLNKLECQLSENLNLAEVKAIIENLVNYPSGPAEISCLGEMKRKSNGAIVNFNNIIDLYECWADMNKGNGYSTQYFQAKVRMSGGLLDTIEGSFCKPMRNCDECTPVECERNPTLSMSFALTANPGIGDEIKFILPAGDCIELVPNSILITGPPSTQIQSWINTVESNAPYIDMSYDATTQRFQLLIDTDYLGPDCACDSHAPFVLQVNNTNVATDFVNCCVTNYEPMCISDDSITLYYNVPSVGWIPGDKLTFNGGLMDSCVNLGINPEWTYTPTYPSFNAFLNDVVTSLDTFPGITAYLVGTTHLYIRFSANALGDSCKCNLSNVIYNNPSGSVLLQRYTIASPPGYNVIAGAEINCCGTIPFYASSTGCHRPVDSLRYVLSQEIEILSAGYSSALLSWQNSCITYPGQYDVSPLCQDWYDSLELAYDHAYDSLRNHYAILINAAMDTCNEWSVPDSFSYRVDCVADIQPFPTYPYVDPCVDHLQNVALYNAQLLYDNYLDSVKNAFRRNYTTHCMSAMEEFKATYRDQEYHFTLYYYDQGGNLVRTVPPKAVSRFTDQDSIDWVKAERFASHRFVPLHARIGKEPNYLATEYRYNSLNQPVEQKTPDGGLSEFWYDELGRLVISQNAKQRTNDLFSYTRFDVQGRITEVGQAESIAQGMNGTIASDQSALNTWILGATKTEVTQTWYDIDPQLYPLINGTQANLRKRVAATTYEDVYDADSTTYNAGTYYSYDIHGNVKQLWQHNRELEVIDPDLALHTMHYYYDLVSGKVNAVAYNPGHPDQFFHQYEYDADNRITKVNTWHGTDFDHIGWTPAAWDTISNPLSAISIWPWDEDASYEYYRHGPLARTEIGDLKVQGLDYVYTIHGWIKGVNTNTLNEMRDPGKDGFDTTGNVHRWIARDAFGYMLDYYAGDYKPVKGTYADAFRASKNVSGYGQNIVDLFNGNISGMTTTLKEPGTYTIRPQGTQYRYDQLNRLVSMEAYQNLDLVNNTWNSETAMRNYAERYTYDPNGNILSLYRNGHATIDTALDNLTYHYNARTNQLNHVTDVVSAGNYADDIDNQGINNYVYDAIGNLIQDAAEDIANIEWTVYGKVKKVERGSGSPKHDITFNYGADGQRISKTIHYDYPGFTNDSTVTIYYVRDASGNIMATYRKVYHSLSSTNEYYLTERHIYGSSRLGYREEKLDLINNTIMPSPQTQGIIYVERGHKRYELSNHLSNVVTILSDLRNLSCSGGTTADYYEADIVMSCDYSSFGVALENRSWNPGAFRYGFSGMEKDNEIKGEGNSYDFGERIYDNRLARFLSTDPMEMRLVGVSPYNYAMNSPISLKDLDGKYPIITIHSISWGYEDGYTLVEVSMSIEVKVKVLNVSGKAFNTSAYIEELNKKSKNLKYSGTGYQNVARKEDGSLLPTVNGAAPKVKFRVTDIVIKAVYEEITSLDQLQKGDDLLLLVNGVVTEDNRSTVGLSDHLGVNLVDVNFLSKKAPGQYKASIHEKFHDFGLEDLYKYENGVFQDPYPNNLMGSIGNENYTLDREQVSEMGAYLLNMKGLDAKGEMTKRSVATMKTKGKEMVKKYSPNNPNID